MRRDIKIIPNILDERDNIYSILLEQEYIGSILIDDEDAHIKFVKRVDYDIQKEIIDILDIYM